jgi:hypothetical protein
MGRQIALLVAAFAIGTALAAAFGAINLGTAFGVGQISFSAALVWLLLRQQ